MRKIIIIDIKENEKGKFNLYVNGRHYGTYSHIWTALEKAYGKKSLYSLNNKIRIVDRNNVIYEEDNPVFMYIRDKYCDRKEALANIKLLEFDMENMFIALKKG